jgi:hypothetical protein
MALNQRSISRVTLAMLLTLPWLLQSCVWTRKPQCNALIKNTNQINRTWNKVIAFNKEISPPRSPQELSNLATKYQQFVEEADPLIDRLEQQSVSDKILKQYWHSLLRVNIDRSNLLRKISNVLKSGAGEFVDGAPVRLVPPIEENKDSRKKSPKEPLMTTAPRWGGSPREEFRLILQSLPATEEALLKEELSTMRRVSSYCKIPMPKV